MSPRREKGHLVDNVTDRTQVAKLDLSENRGTCGEKGLGRQDFARHPHHAYTFPGQEAGLECGNSSHARMRQIRPRAHPLLGSGAINVDVMAGGVKSGVVAPGCEARVGQFTVPRGDDGDVLGRDGNDSGSPCRN